MLRADMRRLPYVFEIGVLLHGHVAVEGGPWAHHVLSLCNLPALPGMLSLYSHVFRIRHDRDPKIRVHQGRLADYQADLQVSSLFILAGMTLYLTNCRKEPYVGRV